MKRCWESDPEMRPNFSELKQKLSVQLEEMMADDTYLSLDAQKDYYTVMNADDGNKTAEETREST